MHAVLGTDELEAVGRSLAAMLGGPVFCNAFSCQYYVLVRGADRTRWPYGREAPFLGEGTYLGVPAVRRTSPPGPYWVALPQQPGDLCSLTSVAALVAVAVARRTEEPR
ncbi:hypothetical protein [Streptomyces sp. NPDC002564]|uniref:hypothetical protein n=1 Tax=Streptomyces sp. NPDC002564 TaxID=3364649 RepID=UPI00367D0272